ncbi:uncharacterized protein WM294_012962 [Sarcoramphus papa]
MALVLCHAGILPGTVPTSDASTRESPQQPAWALPLHLRPVAEDEHAKRVTPKCSTEAGWEEEQCGAGGDTTGSGSIPTCLLQQQPLPGMGSKELFPSPLGRASGGLGPSCSPALPGSPAKPLGPRCLLLPVPAVFVHLQGHRWDMQG